MGLFGGYKQKNYDSNTELFKNYIDSLHEKCLSNRGFLESIKELDNKSNVVQTLLKIKNLFDTKDVIGKIDVKQLEFIDQYTLKFLQHLQEDIRSNKPAMFNAHLNMLLSMADSRSVCSEPRDEKTLVAETKLQETCALLKDVLQEKVAVVNAMRELEEEGSKLEADDPAMDLLEIKYSELESSLETLQIKATEYRNTYNDNVLVVKKMQGMEDMYQQLDERDIESPQAISKRISDLNRKGEMRAQRHETVKEQFSMLETPAAVGKSSGFRAKTESVRQANLEKSIDAADGISETTENKSSFRAKIGK